MEVATIIDLARGYEQGKNPIEDASRDGGLFVDEETIALVAKMETVLGLYCQKKTKRQFFSDLMQVFERATEEHEDPIEAVETWLNAWLETEN